MKKVNRKCLRVPFKIQTHMDTSQSTIHNQINTFWIFWRAPLILWINDISRHESCQNDDDDLHSI